ncbi:MAG TPA: glycosyltransferase family 2 protein [Desulfuromonadales bacterium]|nr:glycosyltransferase family 2 protein [Desulfuromonadales bacterium]
MVPVSVVIITFNEERNIERCLRSVSGLADEIIVLDSLSTDQTEEICRQLGATFISQPFLGYVEQKNKAVEYASHHQILSLDADEVLSEELKASIMTVRTNWNCDGYSFNRLTNYCGSWIRHCGWYPDRKLRLFDRRKGRWVGDTIHERFELHDGSSPQHLSGDLLHYSYDSIDQHLDQIKKFTTIMAQVHFNKGNRAGLATLVMNPIWCFIRQYFIRLGILDGYHGLVICVLSACANFVKYAKIRDLFSARTPSA